MRDLENLDYHPVSEKLVEVLCNKTQNNNPLFFRVLVSFYFAKLASMMRCRIKTHDRGEIPINLYALNLATSGYGKGHSTNIIEEQVINQFRDVFLNETFPEVSETNLAKLAVQRANKKSIATGTTVDPDEELERVRREFEQLGALAFSFDSGTPAAVKQMRHKLLMANAGSMNLHIDEIGSNLLGQTDVLNTFLELFDVGKIKQKLVKNTADNTRNEEIEGKTPTNLLLFGTPSKLLDGGRVEEALMSFFDTGYARRCIFGYTKNASKADTRTKEEIYDMLTDKTTDAYIDSLSNTLGVLAEITNFNQVLTMTKDVMLHIIEYKSHCEKIAEALPDHEEIRKAEISHRYFKALKLAGTYAFIDAHHEITEDYLYNAIKIVEDSGRAFESLLTRDRNYVKLAKYIADIGREVTHVDLVEDLPFYKGSEGQKRELMTLAIAYGYKNNIIIKKSFNDGIEFLKGESLKETNLDKLILSHSTNLADGYTNEEAPFDQLHNLMTLPNHHWTNHHVLNNYRNEENIMMGFNMVVIDVDNGTQLSTAQLLLKDYKAMYYKTKQHTDAANRFRIILPLSHTLKLDAKDFKEFMENIYEWLPFSVDDSTGQRSRKWRTCDKGYEYSDGQLLDALLFIPKTSKNEERKSRINDQQSLDNLERWFVNNTGTGNRSNQLIKYALLLVDDGMPLDMVSNKVLTLNSKLQDKMDEIEIHSTILLTAAKAVASRNNN